ncbi:MAG: hypothetical protein II786_02155 [Muribaculaceae bacterium]|nr:hypothetical protein [Muribaculaceae bacterium]
MKKRLLALLVVAMGMGAVVGAQTASQAFSLMTCATDSAAYFPQMSDDGKFLLYSNTEGSVLTLFDPATHHAQVVADKHYPGFDARFDAQGRIYYVTQERKKNGLVYRTGWCYDPATGKHRVVLKAQHGQMVVLRVGPDVVIVGEKKTYQSAKRVGTYAFTRGSHLHLVADGRETVLQPAGECAGYLWAQVSPDGSKVLFEAVARGLYVCDLQGRVLQRLQKCLMPSWLDDSRIVAMGNNGNVQRDMRSGIILLQADGSDCQTLTAEDGCIQPTVTASGKILYTTKEGVIHLLNPSDGSENSPQPILNQPKP